MRLGNSNFADTLKRKDQPITHNGNVLTKLPHIQNIHSIPAPIDQAYASAWLHTQQ